MPGADRVLILSDGGLPSLVACVAAGQSDGASTAGVSATMWESAESASRFAAVARQAELLGLRTVPIAVPAFAVTPAGPGLIQTPPLIHAAIGAAVAGFTTVVWPVHSGPGADPDLDRVALAIDRALLVSRLVALDAADHGCPAIRVDTPYADFTDHQLAELALDLDAPIHTCWWWGGQGGSAAAERQRWTATLQSCGWVPV